MKRPAIIILLTFISLALFVISLIFFWNYSSLKIQVAFASEQTQIFEEMQVKALQSGVADAANCLEYVVNYYPSGTKQDVGSRLDNMVERERKQAELEIINYLRIKTGEDLGEHSEAWINKFAVEK